MLALGRALMLAPKILLVDEPSVGLAPLLVARTIDAIKELKDKYQLTVLMAEQNFTQAMRIADRGYVIVHGKIAVEGRSAAELNNNELIRKFYLGLIVIPACARIQVPQLRARRHQRARTPAALSILRQRRDDSRARPLLRLLERIDHGARCVLAGRYHHLVSPCP